MKIVKACGHVVARTTGTLPTRQLQNISYIYEHQLAPYIFSDSISLLRTQPIGKYIESPSSLPYNLRSRPLWSKREQEKAMTVMALRPVIAGSRAL